MPCSGGNFYISQIKNGHNWRASPDPGQHNAGILSEESSVQDNETTSPHMRLNNSQTPKPGIYPEIS